MPDTAKQNVQPASLKEAGLFSAMQDRLNAPFTGPLLSDLTSIEDGVGDGQNCLTAKDVQDMEAILRAGMIGYAYVYPHGGEIPDVYVFSMTPENIASFIGQHQADCSEMTLTDQMDITILTTFGGFIDKCPDREMLQNVLQHLVPIQMGESSPKDVPAVSMDTMDLYNEILEQTQSEMRMEM